MNKQSIGIQIMINATIILFAWAGLMCMSSMANAEKNSRQSGRVEAAEQRNRSEAQRMVNAQIRKASADYKHCTSAQKPFLTDHILIRGAHVGGNIKYDTGVVYEVTMREAFAQPKGSIVVLAYCE